LIEWIWKFRRGLACGVFLLILS